MAPWAGVAVGWGGVGSHTAKELSLQVHLVERLNGLIVVRLNLGCARIGQCWFSCKGWERQGMEGVAGGVLSLGWKAVAIRLPKAGKSREMRMDRRCLAAAAAARGG